MQTVRTLKRLLETSLKGKPRLRDILEQGSLCCGEGLDFHHKYAVKFACFPNTAAPHDAKPRDDLKAGSKSAYVQIQ